MLDWKLWDSRVTPIWKGWHKAHTSVPQLFQILNRGRRLTDLRLVFYTWELHQLGFGHSSRGRKALATEVPFSPLTTPLISVWPTRTFWALHKPFWTKHPETSFLWLQLSWADNAFLVSFPLTLSCFLLCYPANSDLLPQTLLLYSRKLLCSLCCVPDATKWVFQGTVFTFLIIRKRGPSGGSMDFILRQLNNNYSECCVPILLLCLV